MRTRTVGIALALATVSYAAALGAADVAPTSCTLCHADPDLFVESDVAMVSGYAGDVHAEVGLSCHDCHGGNPDPALADDLDAAMSADWKPNPYRGAWSPRDIPRACGRCHSDPELMRRSRPDFRVDQEAEYASSHHGRALAAGNEQVATCVSCHGVHAIRRATDPLARTHSTRVAETCGGCHSDAERMRGITRNGEPLPVNQQTLWGTSVHATALLAGGDLSAPTCNDCHGNHGATPTGVESLAFACGQCHVRESQLFSKSGKFAALAMHNEFLAEAGTGGCAECHQSPEPAAAVTGTHAFLQCAACHNHHDVVRPTLAMLAPLPETPCAFCHEGPSPVEGGSQPIDVETYTTRRDALIAAGEAQNLKGEELFDWLVDRALELDGHVAPTVADATPTLRPEFSTLFRKLRVGKTAYEVTDPATGATTRRAVVRCSKCHATEPLLTTAEGLPFAAQYLELMRNVAFATARAERLVLRARRGGVEVRAAQDEISRAVDAQIATQALLHGFTLEEGGELRQRFAAADSHAASATRLGEQALAELQARRRGLAGSLVLVVIALVALAIKIRQLG